jgi:HK97 family phage prohead protease
MSTYTVTKDMDHTPIPETPERAFLVREFEISDLNVEGRTVDARLIPFGEVARVSDDGVTFYNEEWMPGVVDHQVNAANRIHAKYGHSPHVIDVVGHGIELRRESDGYHVSTAIHRTPQGDTTLELLNGGALPCVSLEARPVKSMRTTSGVVQRIKANLYGFAFCRQGAFAGAQVLAVREEFIEQQELEPELRAPEIDPELIERCRRLGIALPQRYEAHPAETDTSAESDTSADGTRQSNDPDSEQEDA